MANQAEILEEGKKVRRLQVTVDLALNIIRQTDIRVEEASQLAASVRRKAITLFPDKGETDDLIYAPRFQRLFKEKYKMV